MHEMIHEFITIYSEKNGSHLRAITINKLSKTHSYKKVLHHKQLCTINADSTRLEYNLLHLTRSSIFNCNHNKCFIFTKQL